MDKNSAAGSSVKALDKSLRILEIFADIAGEIDLSTLTKQTQIPKSTLLRLLNTLKNHNFVLQDPQSRRYRLGWALIYLGKAAQRSFNLVQLVHPFLEELASQTGETASLVLLDGDHAVYVDQVTSSNIIRGNPPVGTPLHLNCTSSGKVLLSALSEQEFESFLKRNKLVKKTERSIVEPRVLREEIRRVRKQGYAFDDEETEIGGRCAGAPVYNKEGKIVASISVVGPSTRIRQSDLTSLAGLVARAAARASVALGFQKNRTLV